jgi:hypothetical protein
MEGAVERPGWQLAAKILRVDSALGGWGGVRSSPCSQLALTRTTRDLTLATPTLTSSHPHDSGPHPQALTLATPTLTPALALPLSLSTPREGSALQYTSRKKGGEHRAIPWATVRAVRRGDPSKFELVTSQQ